MRTSIPLGAHQERSKGIATLLFTGLVALLLATGVKPALADEDPWPCQVALCMANPQGPTAVDECRPPVERAWKAWAKKKKVPECHKKNGDGSDGGELRASGTYIDHSYSDPYSPSQCPFSYYAGRERHRYCAFVGVTNQYVDGQMWGRIWYGGPGGVPYIEMLHVDPAHPRAPDGFEAAWVALKKDIEDKSEYSALAYKIWEASEARAVAEEQIAAAARAEADQAAQQVTYLENWLPGEIAAQTANYKAASASFNATVQQLRSAEAALAKDPKNTAAQAAVDALSAEATALLGSVNASADALTQATNLQATLPALRTQADVLAGLAGQAETRAADLRTTAIKDKAESVAAEEAAKPLPDYGGD